MTEKNIIKIKTDSIKFDSFLKFATICDTGGEAKILIQSGDVLLNGTVCKQRGKMLYPGDTVEIDDVVYIVKADDKQN